MSNVQHAGAGIRDATPARPAGPPSGFEATKPTSGATLIRCTFCHHLAPAPGRVLGRSARLTCDACHGAVLDLAAC